RLAPNWSALPSASRRSLSVTSPTVSLTLPPASSAEFFILSSSPMSTSLPRCFPELHLAPATCKQHPLHESAHRRRVRCSDCANDEAPAPAEAGRGRSW